MTRLMMLLTCVTAMIGASMTARDAPVSQPSRATAGDVTAASNFVIPPLQLKELQISVSGKPQMIFRAATGSTAPSLQAAVEGAFDRVATADLMPPPPATYQMPRQRRE